MNRSFRKSLTFFLIWSVLGLGSMLLMIDATKSILKKENITKVIDELDLNKIAFVDKKDSTAVSINRGNYPYMGMSQKDVEEIINSKEYAEVLGDYMSEADVDIEGEDILDQDLSEISQERMRKILEKYEVDYTDQDISYLRDSVRYVVPQLYNFSNNELNNAKAESLMKIFDKKRVNKVVLIYIVLLIIACGGIIFLQHERYYFFILLGGCSTAIAVLAFILSKFFNTILNADWQNFDFVKKYLLQPIKGQFIKDGVIILILGIVMFGLYALFNFTILRDFGPRSLDEIGKVFKKTNDMDTIGVELKLPDSFDTMGELKEPDTTSVDIVDYDKEFEEFEKNKSRGI